VPPVARTKLSILGTLQMIALTMYRTEYEN